MTGKMLLAFEGNAYIIIYYAYVLCFKLNLKMFWGREIFIVTHGSIHESKQIKILNAMKARIKLGIVNIFQGKHKTAQTMHY